MKCVFHSAPDKDLLCLWKWNIQVLVVAVCYKKIRSQSKQEIFQIQSSVTVEWDN